MYCRLNRAPYYRFRISDGCELACPDSKGRRAKGNTRIIDKTPQPANATVRIEFRGSREETTRNKQRCDLESAENCCRNRLPMASNPALARLTGKGRRNTSKCRKSKRKTFKRGNLWRTINITMTCFLNVDVVASCLRVLQHSGVALSSRCNQLLGYTNSLSIEKARKGTGYKTLDWLMESSVFAGFYICYVACRKYHST